MALVITLEARGDCRCCNLEQIKRSIGRNSAGPAAASSFGDTARKPTLWPTEFPHTNTIQYTLGTIYNFIKPINQQTCISWEYGRKQECPWEKLCNEHTNSVQTAPIVRSEPLLLVLLGSNSTTAPLR